MVSLHTRGWISILRVFFMDTVNKEDEYVFDFEKLIKNKLRLRGGKNERLLVDAKSKSR